MLPFNLVLMAFQRLNSDRAFAIDRNEQVYTKASTVWANDTDMFTVLVRHFGALVPAWRGGKNPF
jgi:hypothetical protein